MVFSCFSHTCHCQMPYWPNILKQMKSETTKYLYIRLLATFTRSLYWVAPYYPEMDPNVSVLTLKQGCAVTIVHVIPLIWQSLKQDGACTTISLHNGWVCMLVPYLFLYVHVGFTRRKPLWININNNKLKHVLGCTFLMWTTCVLKSPSR